MLNALIFLISLNFTLEMGEPQTTSPVWYYDEQSNFWPCITYPEGTLCQKDSTTVLIYK
jgi:hypothetical protein